MFKALQVDKDGPFCEMIQLVNGSYKTLKEMSRPNNMNNNHMLALIEQKMSSDYRKVWARGLETDKKEATLEDVLNWMTTEIKSRMKESAPLRNQEDASGTSTTSDMKSTKGTNTGYAKPPQTVLTSAQSYKS